MPAPLRLLTTTENEFEADMVCGLLSEAGIQAMQQLSNRGAGGRVGGGGARDVYVEESDLERAREMLAGAAED